MKPARIGGWILLALALVVAAAFVAWLDRAAPTAGVSGLGAKLLPDFPAPEVARIHLEDGSDAVTLVRTDAGWRVAQREYPADEERVRAVLLKMRELKVLQSDPVTPAQRARLELTEPAPTGSGAAGGGADSSGKAGDASSKAGDASSKAGDGKAGGSADRTGMRVEFADAAGKSIAKLIVGKQQLQGGATEGGGLPVGRYVLIPGKEQALVISDLLTDLVAKPPVWLSKAFVRIEKARSITVAGPGGQPSWAIARDSENSPWRFADSKPGALDEGKAGEVARAFEAAGFTDVVGPLAAHADKLDGATTVTVATIDGATWTVRIGREATPEQRYFAVSGGPAGAADAYDKWVYLLPARTVEMLLRPRDQLLPEKPPAK